MQICLLPCQDQNLVSTIAYDLVDFLQMLMRSQVAINESFQYHLTLVSISEMA